MPRSSRRRGLAGAPRGEREGKGRTGSRAPARAGKDAFNRLFEMLASLPGRKITVREARDRFSDMVRMAGRLRGLERRLGKRGVASLSPYLKAVLRLATESNIIVPATLRRAASF